MFSSLFLSSAVQSKVFLLTVSFQFCMFFILYVFQFFIFHGMACTMARMARTMARIVTRIVTRMARWLAPNVRASEPCEFRIKV